MVVSPSLILVIFGKKCFRYGSDFAFIGQSGR